MNEPEEPEREAWGPRDWGSNGIGGADFDLRPTATERRPQFEDEFEGDGEDEDDGAPAEPSRRRRRGQGDGAAAAPAEPADPAARARALCLRLLTGAAKTRKQLGDAMRKREFSEEVIEEVLSRYQEVGLIDDAAFAEAWVESRHRGRGLARRALAMELRSKGVDNALVAEAVERLDPEQEADTARQLVERKLRSTRGLDRQVRIRRLAGMLARRGYSEGMALRVVRAVLDAEEELE